MCSRARIGTAVRVPGSGRRFGTTLGRIRTAAWVFARPVTLLTSAIARVRWWESLKRGKMGIHSEAQLNRKFMEFAALMNIYLNHFPKHEKYALSNRIRNTAYEMYDLISESQKRYYKKATLTLLDITHEKLRMQIYLANEMGYFRYRDGRRSDKQADENELHRYTAISSMIDELGKMIGAWIKKIKEENKWS